MSTETNNFEVELSDYKKVTINKFKNNYYVDIREYYRDNDGEMKPGRKGISLSIDQWETLTDNIKEINQEIKNQTSSKSKKSITAKKSVPVKSFPAEDDDEESGSIDVSSGSDEPKKKHKKN